MTDRAEYSDRDIDRLYERVYDQGKQLDAMLNTSRISNEVLCDAINKNAKRHEKKIRKLTKRLDRLESAAENNHNNLAKWTSAVVSNLYDNPFPPATDAEWDEAHRINATRDLFERDPAVVIADTFMGIFGYYRDEADCECTCCKAREELG